MLINWFCPLLPQKTDIAHYTNRILQELTQNTEIVLWTSQKTWLPELDSYCSVQWYDPKLLSAADFSNSDLNIYHIGNNNDFHGSIWQISRQYPGIVVIHDVNLHYLLTCHYANYMEPGADRDAYVDLVKRYHGNTCQQDLNRFFTGKLDWSTIAERYPLTFAAVENALGVIVHTQAAYETLALDSRCSCPVLYSPLPYPAQPIHPVSRSKSKSFPPYKLIIFGYLGGTYRRVQAVLEALGMMAEKELFHLDIYGQIWDENYIKSLITKFGLETIVSLHGFVEERELDQALANADLAINLRYPTGGEASGSQMRIWSHGLPSLVTRIGWYADLPDNTVAFVSHNQEILDIQKKLRNFITNYSHFQEIGRQGKVRLTQFHDPELYVCQVVDFAEKIKTGKTSFTFLSKPRVSVIITSYNCANYLPQAIESVLQQTYTDYEVILVDDGSTDNTQEVIKPYRNHLRYSHFQHQQGMAAAKNRGFEMARGQLISFLDPHDYLLGDKLASEVTFFENHNAVGMINSGFQVVDELGNILLESELWHQYPQLNLESWVFMKPIVISTLTIRREWLEWVGGFDTNFDYAEDINFIFRLALINCQADWLPQVTVCHRQSNSLNGSEETGVVEFWERAFHNLLNQRSLPENIKSHQEPILHNFYVWLAWKCYQTGNTKSQIRYLQKSLAYKQVSVTEAISSWVDLFRHFSYSYGLDFDAYALSEHDSWKQLMRSILVS